MYGTLGVIHMDYKMLKYARLLVHMPLINGRRSFHQYIAKSNILEMSTMACIFILSTYSSESTSCPILVV